ncbi:MAG: GNAT family N-acetyltransferase [Bacteroidales bacterium]|nr:GNAT family N-acetyltransferase [Bacteroidales bacterium]MDD3665384.1 GNAT family N-acetyltransferase [Bacteroidales bacterium]
MAPVPNINLRAVELHDAPLIMEWENDHTEWIHSGTTLPFSRYQIEQYVMEARGDFWDARQLRLMVTAPDGNTVGAVDLFEADARNRRAGLGIIIAHPYRGMGYGKAALLAMTQLAFDMLNLHQLWCNILTTNTTSTHLFETAGWQCCGVRRQWFFHDGAFHDASFYQLINPRKA